MLNYNFITTNSTVEPMKTSMARFNYIFFFDIMYKSLCTFAIKKKALRREVGPYVFLLVYIACTKLCYVYNKCRVSPEVNAVDRDRVIHSVNISHHQLSSDAYACFPFPFLPFFLFCCECVGEIARRLIIPLPTLSPGLFNTTFHCTICPFTLIHDDEGTLSVSL